LDDFIESHLANIDKLILVLRHGGYPVAHLEPSVHLRRAAWNKVLNLCVAILRAKHGSDAHERQAHVNAEVLHVSLAQILGVRIVGLSERIEKKLHLLVLVLLVDVASEAVITAPNQLRRGLRGSVASTVL